MQDLPISYSKQLILANFWAEMRQQRLELFIFMYFDDINVNTYQT